ncbi:MAG: Gfo/Idh/MocA family oxidoreductase [Bacteroidales bacterium]|nr:Gfo/Idh/MocA family oxidoreductase [Bacteroidales bacterium]
MIRIGIISPSEIAFRRFMPALSLLSDNFKFVGIAYATPQEWFDNPAEVADDVIENQQIVERNKAQQFIDNYGGKLYHGYESLIKSDDVDAVYIPLPPALHYKWAEKALTCRKHVFVEKPSTITLQDSKALVNKALSSSLALHENYMFVFHNQIDELKKVIDSGEIGDVRLYRMMFGFPRRQQSDFRYNKKLGGGTLFDNAGYTVKSASFLLGDTARIVSSNLGYVSDFDVDVFGSATMKNADGIVAQLAFGMDCDYRCELEVWGSKGTIIADRFFTAPAGFTPKYTIKKNQDIEQRNLPADDTFRKSLLYFKACIENENTRKESYISIVRQAELIEQIITLNNNNN